MFGMSNKYRLILLSLIVVLLSCTAQGAARVDDAALLKDPDAMRIRGHELTRKGDKLLAKGEKYMSQGRAMLEEGEELIKKGNAGVERSRDEYRNLSQSRGIAAEPDSVKKEAKRLMKIAENWQDSVNDVRKGDKLVKKGNKKIEKARDDLREGSALAENGNALIHNSEFVRRGEPIPIPVN